MKVLHIYSHEEASYAAEDVEILLKSKKNIDIILRNLEKTNPYELKPGIFIEEKIFPLCNVTKDFVDFVKDAIGDQIMLKHESFFVLETID